MKGFHITLLPETFYPSDFDVILGRGPQIYEHEGNVRFRRLIFSRLASYANAGSKQKKSEILQEIVAQVRSLSPLAGFVRLCQKTERWFEVGDFLAREKVSQAFRDALHDQYKSSNSNKKKNRRNQELMANGGRFSVRKLPSCDDSNATPSHRRRKSPLGETSLPVPTDRLTRHNIEFQIPPNSSNNTSCCNSQKHHEVSPLLVCKIDNELRPTLRSFDANDGAVQDLRDLDDSSECGRCTSSLALMNSGIPELNGRLGASPGQLEESRFQIPQSAELEPLPLEVIVAMTKARSISLSSVFDDEEMEVLQCFLLDPNDNEAV